MVMPSMMETANSKLFLRNVCAANRPKHSKILRINTRNCLVDMILTPNQAAFFYQEENCRLEHDVSADKMFFGVLEW